MSRIHGNPLHIYTYLNITIIPKQLPIIQEQPSNQTTHCLAQPLAQTEGSRSGETVSLRRDGLAQASPLRLGEGSKKEAGTNAGSRLGETPLAWASCSLAQNDEQVAWATFREKNHTKHSTHQEQ